MQKHNDKITRRKMALIKTSECSKCIHSHIDATDKARVTVHCDAKGKEYFYGQYVECDMKKKKRNK